MANPGYVFRCVHDPNRSCLQQFLEDRPELTYVHVKPDGDCFFNSIAEYYKRTGEQIHGLDPTDVVALRKFIMERARPIIDENEAMRQQILADDLNMQKKSLQKKKKSAPKRLLQKKEETNDERLDKIFNKLSERYEYTDAAFDVIVQITPFILNVNLSIYSMTFGTVSNTLHPAQNPDAPTIILYLSGAHYGLLYPIDGPNVRSNAQKIENMQADKHQHNQNNATNALIKKLMAQSNSNQNSENEENVQKAKKASRKKGKAPAQQSRKASHHNNNNNNGIADLERQIVEARKQRALRAQAKANAALASSFSAISFNSRNNRSKLEQQNALNGSRKSIKKKPPVGRNVDLCKGMTIPEIRQLLLSMGVDEDAIPPRMLKRDLCALYKSLTE